VHRLVKRIVCRFLGKYIDRRLDDARRHTKDALIDLHALEAECRMYRIRLGWEMPGRFVTQGHWVWHANDGSQKPFPGVRWTHVMPPSLDRIKDYRD